MTNLYLKQREQDGKLCWRLLNDGKRACVLERGHDEDAHEELPVKACRDSDPHDPHEWTEKVRCDGIDDAEPGP